MNMPMKLSMKSMGLKTPRGLALLILLALIALFGAGMSRAHSVSGPTGGWLAPTQ